MVLYYQLVHNSRVTNNHSILLAMSIFGDKTSVLMWTRRQNAFFHAATRGPGVIWKHSLYEMNSLECNDS